MLGFGKKKEEIKKQEESLKEILRTLTIRLIDTTQQHGFDRRMVIEGDNICVNDILVTLERAKFITLLNESKKYVPDGGPVFIDPNNLPEPAKKEPANYIG